MELDSCHSSGAVRLFIYFWKICAPLQLTWKTGDRASHLKVLSEAGSYGCHISVKKVMAFVDSTKPLISEHGVANSLSNNDPYLNDVCTPLEQSICSINT
jgi:hypothetical protein